jgi:hypothetical protein
MRPEVVLASLGSVNYGLDPMSGRVMWRRGMAEVPRDWVVVGPQATLAASTDLLMVVPDPMATESVKMRLSF